MIKGGKGDFTNRDGAGNTAAGIKSGIASSKKETFPVAGEMHCSSRRHADWWGLASFALVRGMVLFSLSGPAGAPHRGPVLTTVLRDRLDCGVLQLRVLASPN